MICVIQRVAQAQVMVKGQKISQIGKGLLIFLGLGVEDSEKECDKFVDKIYKLRIFSDEQGKMNKSLQDVNGEVLIVSQFTLLAELKGQNRPSFTKALGKEKAERLYNYFVDRFSHYVPTKKGAFGQDMEVHLINDGPVTLVLSSTDF